MESEGLDVVSMTTKKFDEKYSPIPNYPIEKAAKLYTSYAVNLGATQAAVDALRKHTHMTEKEIHMATSKKAAASEAAKKPAAKPAAKTAATKPAAKPVTKPAAKPAATKPAAKAEKSAAKPARERGETAAKMFQDLIMEGKLTDQRIFEKVAAKFNLDESKRGYVNWYRNYLTKQGKNPPAAKQGK
jgi:predicted component of type VI protein secretion system